MCRWTHTLKHTLLHRSGMYLGILIFRCVNAHVYHVEDLHFCTVSWQIHTHFPKQLITHKSCHNTTLPTHYTFKSSSSLFIDSNLRIVLEFWHLLILNLLTPGRPELNITTGIYLNTYKENIPQTPWIVAIHAHKRDSNWSVFSSGAPTRDSSKYLQWQREVVDLRESSDRWFCQHLPLQRRSIQRLLSFRTGAGRVETARCIWACVPVCVRLNWSARKEATDASWKWAGLRP